MEITEKQLHFKDTGTKHRKSALATNSKCLWLHDDYRGQESLSKGPQTVPRNVSINLFTLDSCAAPA